MNSNLSIDTLDLSYNKINDSDGIYIAKIISNQTQLRDSQKFHDQLRVIPGKKKSNSAAIGLTTLILKQNSLGYRFA